MKRKFISLTICLAMVLSLMGFSVTVSADANFSGSGTEADPFLIGTASDLTTLASLTNATATASDYADKYYKLTADIDMTGISYKPISWGTDMYNAQGARFTGTFDGDGHIIRNIDIPITHAQTYGATVGLIGILGTDGAVKNIGVENMTIRAGGSNSPTYMCIGGIAGSLAANGMSIDNCYVRGMTVNASTAGSPAYVGGLVGRTTGNAGTITNCYSTGLSFTVTNDANHSAGIMGSCGNVGYSATNCYTTHSKIQGYTAATNSYLGTTNCYSSSTIANATAANLGSAFQTDPNGKSGANALLDWEIIFAGKGTGADPFLISSASDLTTLSTKTNTATLTNTTGKKIGAHYAASGLYYKLTADIDMSDISYMPISWGTDMYNAQGARFAGTLDGDGHIIRNINIPITYAQSYGATAGLIGILGTDGTVKNLGIENMNIRAGGSNSPTYMCIGGIAGSLAANGMSIGNCYVRGMTVNASTAGSPAFVGGLVGRTIGNAGTITNCYSTGLSFTVTNDANHSAGIIGSCGNTGYRATNCYTTHAKIEGYAAATNSYITKTNCYTSSTIANATASALNATAFKNDVYEKNSGHAILKWEKDIDAVLTLTESAGTLTASASVTNYVGSARNFRLIIAKYNGAAETEVKNLSQTIVTAAASGTTADTATMTKDENTEYKAFLLYGSDFYPVVISQKLDFSE